MAQQRYYVSCPDCRTRMVRTGKKVKEYRSLYETWVYKGVLMSWLWVGNRIL